MCEILRIGCLHEREHQQTESFVDSIDGISLDSGWGLSSGWLQKVLSSAGLMCNVCESSRLCRALSPSFYFFHSVLLSLVSHASPRARTARSIGDAVACKLIRASRATLLRAALVTKILLRLSRRYFIYVYHTKIHGVCRRFFVRRDTRWEFRPQNPGR